MLHSPDSDPENCLFFSVDTAEEYSIHRTETEVIVSSLRIRWFLNLPTSWQLQKLSLTGNPTYSGSKTVLCSGYSPQQQFWGEERTWGGGWGKNKMPFVFKRKTLTSPWISTPP